MILTQIVPDSENNNHNSDNSQFVAKIGIVVAVTMITMTILIILTIILTITPIVGNNTNVHFFRVAIHITVVLISGFGDEHPIILAYLPLDRTTLYLWSESIAVTSLGQARLELKHTVVPAVYYLISSPRLSSGNPRLTKE